MNSSNIDLVSFLLNLVHYNFTRMPLSSFERCDFTPINIQLVCVFICFQIACARGCTIELAALVSIHCAFSNTALMGWDGVDCGHWCRHRSKDYSLAHPLKLRH